MTEQVTKDEAPAENEPLSFPDEMSKVSFDMITDLIAERNSEVGKVNAVKGDRQTLKEQLEESSTDPKVVAARKARDKAQEALDEALLQLHKAVQPEVERMTSNAEDSTKEIEEKIKELDGKIRPAMQFFKKMYGENLAKHLPPLARTKGFSTKGAGSSGRRIRGYSVEVTYHGESTTFDNVAGAAKFLEVETVLLQNGFFEAAGNPAKLADAPNRVEFDVTYDVVGENEDEVTQEVAHIVAFRDEDEADAKADAKSDAK